MVVGAQGETLNAWVVKLLGGLSASACAQRTLDSLIWGSFSGGRVLSVNFEGLGRQAAWRPECVGPCTNLKKGCRRSGGLGRQAAWRPAALLTNCVIDAVCKPAVGDLSWSSRGSAGSACTCLRHAQQIRCRWLLVHSVVPTWAVHASDGFAETHFW